MFYCRYMHRCLAMIAVVLCGGFGVSVAVADDAPVSYRLLPSAHYYTRVLMDWEGKAESDKADDFFGDSAPAQPRANPCKRDSIVGKVNCDVTDAVKKSGAGSAASASASSRSEQSAEAQPEASLELKLIPNIQRVAGGKFQVTLIPDGRLVKKNDPDVEQRLDLDRDERKIKQAIQAWKKIYTKDELKNLAQQHMITLDVSEIFSGTKLLTLINTPIVKLDIWPEPRLAAVYVIGDQSGHAHIAQGMVSDEAAVNTNKFGMRQTRNLAVYMKDYDSARNAEPIFTGEGVSYAVIGTQAGVDEGNGDYKINMEQLKPEAPSGPAGAELVLVRATMAAKTLPSFKGVNFRGQRSYWPFVYSDAGARVEVARQTAQGKWEPVSYALVGDKLRFQYHVTHDIGLDKMPITFAQGKINASDNALKLALKSGTSYQATKTTDGFVYATEPFFITATHWPNMRAPGADEGKKIELSGDTLTKRQLVYLMLSPDPDFTRKQFLGAYAPGKGFLKIPVYIAPPLNTLWKDALFKSAACSGTNIHDWDTLPAHKKEEISRISVHSMGYALAMRYWNGSRIELNPSSDVMMGQHAALILMRLTALGVLEGMANQFDDISQDVDRAKSYYINLPNFRFPANHPLQLSKVRMPDGGRDGYAQTMQDDGYLKEKYGLNDRELLQWRVDATQQATGQMAGYISKAAKQIRDTNPCKTKALLRVMGDMYAVVGAATKTSLMKNVLDRETHQDHWVSDEAARHWVDSAIYLSKEVAARDREADLDTAALKAQLMAATLVGAAGSGAPLLTDILGFGVTGFDMAGNIDRFMDVGRDLELARGKAAVLGVGYYARQEQKALTTQKFVVQMALDTFGMAMDGYSALTNLSRIWKARFYDVPVKVKQGLTANEIWARIERDAERAMHPRLPDGLEAAPTRTWDEALNARPEWRNHLNEMGVRASRLEGLNPDMVKALETIVPELKGKKALDAALFSRQRGLNNAETIVGKAWEAHMSPAEIMAKTGMDMEEYTKALAGYLRKGQLVKNPDKVMKVVENSFDPVKRKALADRAKMSNPAYDETGYHPSPEVVQAKTQPEGKPAVDVHAPTSAPFAANNAPVEKAGVAVAHNNVASLQKALEVRGHKSIEDAGLTPDTLRHMEEMSKGGKVDYDKILDHASLSKAVELDETAMLAGHAFSAGRDPVAAMRKYHLSEDEYKAALKRYLTKKEKLSEAKADEIVARETNPEKLAALYKQHDAIAEMLGGKTDPRAAETFMEESVHKAPSALDIKPNEPVVSAPPKAMDEDGTVALPPQPVPSHGPGVVRGNESLRGVDESGKSGDIELGDPIDDGYYNMVFDVKRGAGEEPAVARISKALATDDGIKIDGFGRRALKEADPDIVRAVKREKLYMLDGGRQAEIIKKVDEFAHQQIAKNADGLMTNGQAVAFDKATRELNKKGYVWLDNHHKNYYFERINGTPDGWRVVITDTGGVFKTKGIQAREMQKIVSSPDQAFLESIEGFSPDSGIREAMIRGRSEDMRAKFKDNFDLDAMGVKDFDVLQFRSDGVVAYPKARELFAVETNPNAAYDALKATP